MQQRQPRLGDILDDYCPRERRVTNHVVVAMVGEDVKQTRCTTCDADHEDKHAKVPRQRRKDTPTALSAQSWQAAPSAWCTNGCGRRDGCLRARPRPNGAQRLASRRTAAAEGPTGRKPAAALEPGGACACERCRTR